MQILDVNTPGHGAIICQTLAELADKASAARNVARYPDHIRPSSVGDECTARSWFAWHWAKLDSIDGKVSRNFDRGNDDENKMLALLVDMGFEVIALDPERVATGKHRQQHKFEALDGHMTGFADAFVRHPYVTNNVWVLFEAKSMNAKKWAKLDKNGLYVVDDRYHGQVQLYMRNFNKPWTIFAAVNANDNQIYWETIRPIESITNMLEAKANAIKTSRARPSRVAESPAFYKCKQCVFSGVCHNGEPLDINCRSCGHCVPIEEGKFRCEKWNAIIPNREVLLKGCPSHKPIV